MWSWVSSFPPPPPGSHYLPKITPQGGGAAAGGGGGPSHEFPSYYWSLFFKHKPWIRWRRMEKFTSEDEMIRSCLVSRRKNEVKTRWHCTCRILLTTACTMPMTSYIQTPHDLIHVRHLYSARNQGNTFKILVFNRWLIVTTILRDKC